MFRIRKDLVFPLRTSCRTCRRTTSARVCMDTTTSSSWSWPKRDADGFVRHYRELAPLKAHIDDSFDHRHLNDVLDGPSTAENMAKHFYDWCKAQ